MKVLDIRAQHVWKEIERFNAAIPSTARTLKYQKMAESAFIFFRGTNHLFWQDTSHDWRISLFGGKPASQVWLQGDAHVYNFGALHDHHNRIYYGMDDFDDALVGDYQYDLWRLAISMVLDLSEKAYFSEELADSAVKNLGKAYLKAVINASQQNPAARPEFAPAPIQEFLSKVHTKNNRTKMLTKWTTDNFSRFDLSHAKLESIPSDVYQTLESAVQQYLVDCKVEDAGKILDIAQRTKAGTGSLGSQRYYALVAGDSAKDNVILDIKQQREPAAIAVLPEAEQDWYRSTFSHEGQRHSQAYQAIAEHPDRWLGWLDLDGIAFSVRERSPFKKDFPTEELNEKEYLHMASIWGEILGREHARGSSHVQQPETNFIRLIRQHVQPDRKAFLRVLRAVALNYARCVQQDWLSFKAHL